MGRSFSWLGDWWKSTDRLLWEQYEKGTNMNYHDQEAHSRGANFKMPSQIELWGMLNEKEQIIEKQGMEIQRLMLELASNETIQARLQLKVAEQKVQLAENRFERIQNEFYTSQQFKQGRSYTKSPSINFPDDPADNADLVDGMYVPGMSGSMASSPGNAIS